MKEEKRIYGNSREIYGVLYTPRDVVKSPIVIFSHGFNGTSNDFEEIASCLTEIGVAAYCFDFCGGSVNTKSDLNTTEMTLFTEKEDLIAVIENVKTWENIDPERIFLFGGSQGGLITSLVADEYIDAIRGILLLFPAYCIADDWNLRFPTLESIPETHELWGVQLGRAYFATIHGYDIFKHIGKFNKNVLIFHGDKDSIVDVDYGIRASKLYPNAVIEIFEGEEHGFSDKGNKKVTEMTCAFVKENL